MPQIIADRRAGIVHEIESEKLAREARESARQQEEQERAEAAAQAEQERIRQKRIQEEAGVRKRSVVAEIDQQFQRDFLSTDAFFDSIPSGILSREEYEALKLAFVRRWFDQTAKNRTDRKFQLDDEQIGAIAAVNGNVQVVARAGSGKTATLVNRALFLLQHCRVPAPKILLLAITDCP